LRAFSGGTEADGLAASSVALQQRRHPLYGAQSRDNKNFLRSLTAEDIQLRCCTLFQNNPFTTAVTLFNISRIF
jgi:hypothetical protein